MVRLRGYNVSQFQSYVFSFEERYPFAEMVPLVIRHWHWTFAVVAVYVCLVHAGQRLMRHRPAFGLRRVLFAWNACLTGIYAFMLVRTTPEVMHKMQVDGLHSFVCVFCDNGCSIVYHFWCWVFAVLKFPELLDTAFVVLRKKPLSFLHYFHHSTVLVFTWYLFARTTSAGHVFAFVNAIIHALMYFYYALKSLRVRVPIYVSMTLTAVQILQMVIGLVTNYHAFRMRRAGVDCDVSGTDMVAAFAIYASYFVLFMWYFYKAYIVGVKPIPRVHKRKTERKRQ